MCSSVVSQIIAFFLGIAASFLVWVFTTKVSRVKIVFSEELTGNTDPNNESLYHYNVEVTNKGKRDLIDLHIQAKITIVGADAKNPGLKCFALLNLDYSSNLPYLPPAGSRDKLWPNQNTGRIIYAVNMKDAYAEFSKVFYDPRIQSKARAKTLQLDGGLFSEPQKSNGQRCRRIRSRRQGCSPAGGTHRLILKSGFLSVDFQD